MVAVVAVFSLLLVFVTMIPRGGGGDDRNGDENDLREGEDGKKRKKKKTKKKKKGKEKKKKMNDDDVEREFGLVLGSVVVDTGHGKDRQRARSGGGGPATAGIIAGSSVERLPSRMHQTIRLGKRSYVECAIFLPDGSGLVTGSSDGFVEVWGETRSSHSTPPVISPGDDADRSSSASASAITMRGEDVDYETLRTSDLPYQRNDDLMMHDSSVLAVDVSNDGTLLGTTSSNGTVCIWKLSDGKMLRKLERAHGGIVGLGRKVWTSTDPQRGGAPKVLLGPAFPQTSGGLN